MAVTDIICRILAGQACCMLHGAQNAFRPEKIREYIEKKVDLVYNKTSPCLKNMPEISFLKPARDIMLKLCQKYHDQDMSEVSRFKTCQRYHAENRE